MKWITIFYVKWNEMKWNIKAGIKRLPFKATVNVLEQLKHTHVIAENGHDNEYN